MKKNKIFISIASYRDPELIPTIENCIANAKNPRNLVFGICRQFSEEDKFDDLSKYQKRKSFKIIDIPHKKSLGVCYARNKIQELYDGEEYHLQLDSHHRFVQDWDSKVKDCLNKLKKDGYKKPILSSYLPSYDPHHPTEDRLDDLWRTYIDRFMPEGPIFIFPETIQGWKNTDYPEKARFLSGHFIFSFGNFITEVPYDPNLYFHGEESSLAVRAFTHGFDMFHLPKPWVYHHYGRDKDARHWDDDPKWVKLNNTSFKRYKELLGMDGLKRKHLPKFGLGKERSLQDYEKYSGIRFKDRKIHQAAIDRVPPPVPYKNKKDFESKFVSEFKYCIDLDKNLFPEDDYDVWVIAFKDKNDHEMCRLDAEREEVQQLLNGDPNDHFVRLWRSFETSILPAKWLVWPHSESKGWKDIIEGGIPIDV